MLVLIPAYGVEGAGLALLGSTTARLVFVLMSYPLILKVRPPGLLITREDWRFVQQIIQAKKG
jgi:O-antigen/teichoic acid export membrane protein